MQSRSVARATRSNAASSASRGVKGSNRDSSADVIASAAIFEKPKRPCRLAATTVTFR